MASNGSKDGEVMNNEHIGVPDLAFDAHQAMCSVFASLVLASLRDDSSAVNELLLPTEDVLAIVLCCLV